VAAWFELANVEDRLAWFDGAELRSPYELGMLATAWTDARETRSREEMRHVLARSSWGDPGSDEAEAVHLALRLAWGRRVSAQVPALRALANGAIALLLAGELFVAGRHPDDDLVRRAALGRHWREAATLSQLRSLLPATAAWALLGVDDPADLCQAEIRWWRQVVAEAERMTRSRLDGGAVVLGAVALLAFDAMLQSVALAVAARGAASGAQEVIDALC
jgi:hypothetical protein